MPLLSDNKKTGRSIDLPIKGHCCPTRLCIKYCYARTGHQAWPNSRAKQVRISNYLNHFKNKDISELIKECQARTAVRLNGCGDLNPEHVKAIVNLAEQCQMTQFWGMTRKMHIAEALNGIFPNLHLLLTADATSPKSIWEYQGAMCFGPRRPKDTVPDDDRIKIVFPRHFAGRVSKGMPRHQKDCLAVWHDISGCVECGRCWNWDKSLPTVSRIEWDLPRVPKKRKGSIALVKRLEQLKARSLIHQNPTQNKPTTRHRHFDDELRGDK